MLAKKSKQFIATTNKTKKKTIKRKKTNKFVFISNNKQNKQKLKKIKKTSKTNKFVFNSKIKQLTKQNEN